MDEATPVGRVDASILTDGSALVSWLERTAQGADIKVRRIRPDGSHDQAIALAKSSVTRVSGSPKWRALEMRYSLRGLIRELLPECGLHWVNLSPEDELIHSNGRLGLSMDLPFLGFACARANRFARITPMHTAKNRIALLASVIAVLLLVYFPVCSLSCAISDCSLLPRTKVTKQNEQSSHCHQHRDSDQQPTESHPHSNAPEPPGDSRDCPGHNDAIALLSAKTPIVVQQSVQQAIAALPDTVAFSDQGLAAKSADGRSFRSPPKRAVISVYRI